MTRAKFKKLFMEPLGKEFNVKIYFNGKAPGKYNYQPRIYAGKAYCCQTPKIIVISWLKNNNYTLNVLFHELGHTFLHGRGSNFKGQPIDAELEAELVVQQMCKLLNIKHNDHYLNHVIKNKKSKRKPRIDLIQQCSEKIYSIINNIVQENSEDVNKSTES